MALSDVMEAEGNWLFRRRSYVPLVLLVPLVLVMWQFDWPAGSHRLHDEWAFACMGVSLLGLALRCWTVGHTPHGTSGRNTRDQLASKLNTAGVYSLVRHPLYLGNFVIWFGLAASCLVWWFLAIYVLAFWLYYERIMLAEEAFLRRKFDATFEEWAARTPAFVPRWSGYRPAALPFSWRNVLRREYTGLAGILCGFYALELAEHLAVDRRVFFEPLNAGLAALGLVAYVALLSLKRYTRVLHVPGR